MSQVFFFGTPAHGHINPTLGVVKELISRGDHVVYFCTEEFRPRVEAVGAEFVSYESVTSAPRDLFHYTQSDIANVFSLAAYLMNGTLAVMDELLAYTASRRPDYIIHDASSVWGKLIGRKLGIPAVNSVTTFALNMKMGIRSSRVNMETLRMLLGDATALFRYVRACWRLKRRYGWRAEGLLDVYMNYEPLNIVYTSEALQPEADTFDERFVFVGPSLMPNLNKVEFPWHRLEGKPVIYIAAGTILTDTGNLFRTCMDAFADWNGVVVLSAGPKTDLASLGEIPDNFVVRNFVPQVPLLERADLFITHAGMNSVSEGLLSGVPFIAVPHSADEFMVADQIARVGAGVYLRNGTFSPAELRSQAETILTDKRFRERSRTIGESLLAGGGYTRAVDLIHAHVGHTKPAARTIPRTQTAVHVSLAQSALANGGEDS